MISIHAPVKGATLSSPNIKSLFFEISIHAPVKGATIFKAFFSSLTSLFQSTHP